MDAWRHFKDFINSIASPQTIDCDAIGSLCERAPDFAKALAAEIGRRLKTQERAEQEPKAEPYLCASSRKRRAKQFDCSYRPPKRAKLQGPAVTETAPAQSLSLVTDNGNTSGAAEDGALSRLLSDLDNAEVCAATSTGVEDDLQALFNFGFEEVLALAEEQQPSMSPEEHVVPSDANKPDENLVSVEEWQPALAIPQGAPEAHDPLEHVAMSSADDGSTTVTAKDDPLSRRIPVAESIETSAIQLANVEGDDLQPIPAFRLDELMTPAGGQGRPLRSTPEPGDLHEHATEATTVLNVDEPGSIIVSVEEQQPSLAIRSPEEQCPQEPATISFHIDKPKDSAAPVQERQPSLDIIRSTPVPQTGSTEEQSPQTEEISRMIDREFADAKTIVKEVMGVITQMSTPGFTNSQTPYSAILWGVKADLKTAGTDALHTIESPDNPSNWSVGMWSTFLNASEGRSQRAKISNLLGYIGLSRWFEEKLAEYQPPRTRGGRARIRKATPFLDELLSSEREDSLTLQGGSPKGHASKTRKTITDARAKGGKLRRMISETGIGILLHPNIWAFMKDQASWRRYIAAMDRLGIRVLLPALDDQVDVLIAQGRTDPTKFLQSITLHPALTPDDISEIQVEFDLGPRILAGSMQSDLLDRLIILAKQLFVDSNAMKSTRMKADKKASAALSKRSVLSVSNRDIELASFDNLAPGKWLDAWLILAAMELTDTPSWVQYEPSIVLNSSDRSPFSNWKKRVDKYQRAGKARGVYFAPLHLNNNHYTLLEINTQLGKIFHYDSDAGTGILEGTDQNMLVKETVQAAFSHLHLEYEEAPCPQQDDTSSCGLMVIRNFVKRVGGQAAGTWRDRVRPEAERQELICLFIDAIKAGIIQPKTRL